MSTCVRTAGARTSKGLPLLPTAILVLVLSSTGQAQQMSAGAQQQIRELIAEKTNRSAAQRKMASHLVFATKAARGESLAPSVQTLPGSLAQAGVDARNFVNVEVHAPVTADLLAFLT